MLRLLIAKLEQVASVSDAKMVTEIREHAKSHICINNYLEELSISIQHMPQRIGLSAATIENPL